MKTERLVFRLPQNLDYLTSNLFASNVINLSFLSVKHLGCFLFLFKTAF